MEINDQLDCCGLREMSGIYYGTPQSTIMEFADNSYQDYDLISRYENANFRHVIFSQAGSKATYGRKLAAFITKHRLGTVVSSLTKVNPNTGNPLKVWIWTVNHQRTYNWWKEQ